MISKCEKKHAEELYSSDILTIVIMHAGGFPCMRVVPQTQHRKIMGLHCEHACF